ncbi:rCG36669 [Rattus norvegicus]|uniref:RCG36669 n=1 Tax=Rattus norvegicus TaxID=10116 RepID=A6JSR7_RAT|nr:rCG36669 [Rattus norvegicus]
MLTLESGTIRGCDSFGVDMALLE